MKKQPLLFLCHRIPYPPDKGDKIRAYNILRFLSSRYDLYLGCFVDEARDWQHTTALEELCAQCKFVGLNPVSAKIKSIGALFSREPLTNAYYLDKELKNWVEKLYAENNSLSCFVYSSALAQYVMDLDIDGKRLMDFVDIDSDKWRQYSIRKKWPMNWVYEREADTLFNYEKKICEAFDASYFVSSREASLFREMIGEHSATVTFFNNGVDYDFFSVSANFRNPYPENAKIIVFTGAMDYWPNVDAVEWFAHQVMPELLKQNAEWQFYIVGSSPTSAVMKLDQLPAVTVTGRVDDIRPYMQFACASVAPMRIARGVQNKVLEAMAMSLPVVVSDKGLEGIAAKHGVHVLSANEISEYLVCLIQIGNGDHKDMSKAARALIENEYSWENNLNEIEHSLNCAT